MVASTMKQSKKAGNGPLNEYISQLLHNVLQPGAAGLPLPTYPNTNTISNDVSGVGDDNIATVRPRSAASGAIDTSPLPFPRYCGQRSIPFPAEYGDRRGPNQPDNSTQATRHPARPRSPQSCDPHARLERTALAPSPSSQRLAVPQLAQQRGQKMSIPTPTEWTRPADRRVSAPLDETYQQGQQRTALTASSLPTVSNNPPPVHTVAHLQPSTVDLPDHRSDSIATIVHRPQVLIRSPWLSPTTMLFPPRQPVVSFVRSPLPKSTSLPLANEKSLDSLNDPKL